jgi:serine/threonine-protein kinase HipA
MDREILVYMDYPAGAALVGRLWSRVRKGRETATFEYDSGWLAFRYVNRSTCIDVGFAID